MIRTASGRPCAAGWAAALGLLFAGPQEPTEPASLLEGLPPPAPIAGLHGFVSQSTLEIAGHTLELEAVFKFPGRARLNMSDPGDPRFRQIQYGLGERCFEYAPSELSSRELVDDEPAPGLGVLEAPHTELQLLIELRLAAFLWPEAFVWRGEGQERTAGRLRAVLGPEGRPLELHARSESTGRRASLRGIEWREQAGRHWPARMKLYRNGVEIWSEAVSAVDPKAEYLEGYFVPTDRRTGSEGSAPSGPPPSVGRLMTRIERRFALRKDSTWEAAVEQATRRVEGAREELARRSLELESSVAFELDARGAPTHCLLWIRGGPELAPPVGWARTPECQAVIDTVPGPLPIPQDRVERLTRAIPKGRVGRAPYVRLFWLEGPRAGPTDLLELVLPLEPGN